MAAAPTARAPRRKIRLRRTILISIHNTYILCICLAAVGRPLATRCCHYVFMCFLPSFLRSRGGAVTRITESSFRRTSETRATRRHAPLVKFFKHSGPSPKPTRTDNNDNSDKVAQSGRPSSVHTHLPSTPTHNPGGKKLALSQ